MHVTIEEERKHLRSVHDECQKHVQHDIDKDQKDHVDVEFHAIKDHVHDHHKERDAVHGGSCPPLHRWHRTWI